MDDRCGTVNPAVVTTGLILWLLGFLSSYTMGGFIHSAGGISLVGGIVLLVVGKKKG